MSPLYQILIAVGALLPVSIYLVSLYLSTTNKSRYRHPNRSFFLARGTLTSFEFSNSSIAFGFQIASVSVFLAWGYTYGLAALVNPIFWGLGIFVFALLIPRVLATSVIGESIHGYLTRHYSSAALGRLGAIMTLTGYFGALLAELALGCDVLSIIFPDKIFLAMLATFFIVLIATYIWKVGQRAAIETDQLQLGFCYLGFIALAVALCWLPLSKGALGNASYASTALLSVVLTGMLIGIWRQSGGLLEVLSTSRYTGRLSHRINALLIISVTMLGVLISLTLLLRFFFEPAKPLQIAAASEKPLVDLGQGWINLLSLAALPFFWQFIDAPMWQRIAAIQEGKDGRPVEREVERGLWRVAFESPATWTLAIVIGISLRYLDIGLGDDIFAAFVELPSVLGKGVAELGWWSPILGVVFVAAIMAAMLSTVDSMMMSTVFVSASDLAGHKEGASFEADQRIARRVCYLFCGMTAVAIWGRFVLDLSIVPILMGGYAAQLSLAPAILGVLAPPSTGRPSWKWAIGSVAAGSAGAAVATLYALKQPSWQLYAPLFALGLSFVVYGLGVAYTGILRQTSGKAT